MLTCNIKPIRHLFFISGILTVLSCFILTSASGSEDYKHIDFDRAGFYLQIPHEWKYYAPDQIISPLVSIKIRSKSRDEYTNFEAEIEETEKTNLQLAKMVKENQYYWLRKSEFFETKSKIKVLKSIYGYSDETPSAISYFFKNDREDFIEIDLRFRTWETKEIWKDIDKSILNGLYLQTP